MTNRTGITEITAPIAAGSENTPLAVHFANEQQGGLKYFDTTTDRDNFTKKFRVRCFKSIAYVKDGENNYPSLYQWTGTQDDGSDGAWKFISYTGGIVLADSGGGLPQLTSTVVLSDDFALQAAGDQGGGSLIQLSDAIKQAISKGGSGGISGITVEKMYGDYKSVSDINQIELFYPLEVNEAMSGPGQISKGVATLSIKPNTYEPMNAPSFLGKASSLKMINKGVDTKIFCDTPITPYGMYFTPNDTLQGINIQEDDDKDPNLGGQLTELLGSVNFEMKAPEAGNIKLWFMYHQNGAWIPNGFLMGHDGHAMIIEKSFNAGDDLKMIISGAYYAKGQETITMHVEHTFTDALSLNPDQTLFAVNQFENGVGTSLSRIDFLRRNGVQITPSIYKFDDRFAMLSQFTNGVNQPEQDIPEGQGEEFIGQFGINNLADCKASLSLGLLEIKDNGTDILDFYVDYLIDNTRTSMMRGKEFTATVEIQNDDDAYNLSLFKWTGSKDRPSKIYSSRNNGALNLNSGWVEVKKQFIAKNTDNNIKSYSLDVTVPDDAINLAFVLYPVTAEDPIDLLMREFKIKPKADFTGYAEIENYNLNEVHLQTSDSWYESGQNNQGFASLRYTLNYNPIDGLPLPVGTLIKGGAPFVLDTTKNQVSGSGARGGEGVLKATADGQVSFSCDYILWNEENTDSVVDLWWVLYDVDGNETKIPDSQINFTIPKNTTTHGITKTQPAFVFEIEKGQSIGLRGSANKNDGAFLQSTRATDYMVRPTIEFKKLIP